MFDFRSRNLRAIFALVLVTANVGAPFRSSSFGRALLSDGPQRIEAAAQSVVRVRAVSAIASAIGHRAIVGLRKGGPDASLPPELPWSSLSSLTCSTTRFACQKADSQVVRPNPPLRC